MKKVCKFIFLVFLLGVFGAAFLGQPAESPAASFTIDEATDYYPVGDFIVAGIDAGTASSPGRVYDVLKLQDQTTEEGRDTHDMGDLWATLKAGGVTSTNVLVFGFGLNEKNTTNYVDITDLVMTFGLPGDGSVFFNLNSNEGNTVTVDNVFQGASTAEAQFRVDLGFDFMTKYNADSKERFTIYSTITNVSDGFEIYFLSSEFTENSPVPIPSTLLLLASGLIAFVGMRRKLKKG